MEFGAGAKITLQDVAAQAGIKHLDILDQECRQGVLLSLAQHLVNWQLIGRYLKLTEADIAAVDGDCQTVDEKRIEMLSRWKEKFAFKATYRVFIEALLSCGRAADAIEACKVIAHVYVPNPIGMGGGVQQPQASATVQPQLDVCPPPSAFSEDMNYEQIAVWLTNHPQFVGADYQQDISKLKDARINGFALLTLSESRLEHLGMSIGFHVTLMSIIEDLKSSQKFLDSERLPSQYQQPVASSAAPPTAQDQPISSASGQQKKLGGTSRLSSNDFNDIYFKLKDHAAKWRDIGTALGFSEAEMDTIWSHPVLTVSAPDSWLKKMLTQWLQWAPGDGRGSVGFATRDSLHVALLRAGLGQLAQQF